MPIVNSSLTKEVKQSEKLEFLSFFWVHVAMRRLSTQQLTKANVYKLAPQCLDEDFTSGELENSVFLEMIQQEKEKINSQLFLPKLYLRPPFCHVYNKIREQVPNL